MAVKNKKQIEQARAKVVDCIMDAMNKNEIDYSYLAGFNTALSFVLGELSERGSENLTFQKYLAYQL